MLFIGNGFSSENAICAEDEEKHAIEYLVRSCVAQDKIQQLDRHESFREW